jgi:hypothetical protein
MRTLVPLLDSPDRDPGPWAEAAARGAGAVAVMPTPADPAAVGRLAAAGASPLGRVSLGYATRPLPDVFAEITEWSGLPVQGIFFDHAPAGPYQVGPVVQSVRAARRAGLTTIVLNAGIAVDPIYRGLGATICTFEDTWIEYLKRAGEPFAPGDGHLVLEVPEEELAVARAMVLARGANLSLVTQRTGAFDVSCVHSG